MKVYVVFDRYGDEEISIIGIYDTRQKAEDFINNYKPIHGVCRLDDMEEWVVE